MSLNRSQREKFVATHITHKYNLLHILPGIEQTQLAGLYLKSFYNGVKRNQLCLPESITNGTKFCEQCGVVHIAGVNLEMQVVKRETKTSGKSGRTLQYKCTQCSAIKEFVFEAAEVSRDELQKSTKELVSEGTSAGKIKPLMENESKVKKQSSAKNRAKKRKMNSLSNMLNKKKEADASKKRSLSLNLNDFLQKS
ncbi:Snm1p LALA0_S02e10990g [Lachancea lanzarotensis]|uniref:LALA0S02e10990g1_1 n=1 Tax=Lachancea lanzarotensis TaxID=1245769 RepID=A0A0C7N033_9SACH|nr:uncharacterized protein LALA0_S02e10990g [Lachancea lanzarotensis]CEP61287.1 LALA0S02e10990g1_1 [Lachancea lanzarotensis]